VQDEGKDPVTLRPGDSLLIKPGTVHAHWNASSSANLVFTEDRRRHSARPGRVDIRPSNVCLGCTTNTCESKISEATVAYPPPTPITITAHSISTINRTGPSSIG